MAELSNEEFQAKTKENFGKVLTDIYDKYRALDRRHDELERKVAAIPIHNDVADTYNLLKERTRLIGTDVEDVKRQLEAVLKALK